MFSLLVDVDQVEIFRHHYNEVSYLNLFTLLLLYYPALFSRLGKTDFTLYEIQKLRPTRFTPRETCCLTAWRADRPALLPLHRNAAVDIPPVVLGTRLQLLLT